MKQEYREAFTEVNEIIKLMPLELVNKIPSKFREMIVEEKDNNYIPDIKDARELQEVEEAIEQEIREKYNPDDIFKKRNQNNIEESNNKEENTSMIIVKEEKWYQKIFNIIKGIFKRKFNCVCIANELGVSPQYVLKVLKGHPKYEQEKEIRSKIKYQDHLERKKTNRKLRTENLKGKEDYELEYLRHLQWQHSIEMSKKYLG